MSKREYTHDGLTVLWDSDLCTHCAHCVNTLPDVFELGRRPWVDLTKAPAKEIIETVQNCPSGALRVKE